MLLKAKTIALMFTEIFILHRFIFMSAIRLRIVQREDAILGSEMNLHI